MIELLSAVALLLWGLRMVKTGVQRAFGFRLRRWIGAGTQNRLVAFFAGLAATFALQSSTATALMTAEFASRGYLGAAMAQALMLGANLGSSLLARLLALNVHWLTSVMIIAGVAAFSLSSSKASKGAARAVLGLGMTLLAINLLAQSTEPMREAQVLRVLLETLHAAPVLAVCVAVILTAATASSIATVLLTASLAGAGVVSPELSVALVLGANIGGAIPPVLATLANGASAIRVTVGNLVVRMAGCAAVLPFAADAVAALKILTQDPATLTLDLHVSVNAAVALATLPILDALAFAVRYLVPERKAADDGPRHLDVNILEEPIMALSAAAREALRIGDCVAVMLEQNLDALKRNDSRSCESAAQMDNEVDRLNSAVKDYLAQLGRTALVESDKRRAAQITKYATDLEHIGDIVDRNLCDLVEKKIKRQLSFSAEGAIEIEALYLATIRNLKIAQSILVSGDRKLARQLAEAKVSIRVLEERSAANHLDRLQQGQQESIGTSSLHLDILRDLKRINAHIAAIAFPILAEAGELLETRLVERK